MQTHKKAGSVVCSHCHKKIQITKMVGFSLICPLCGKPGNGLPH